MTKAAARYRSGDRAKHIQPEEGFLPTLLVSSLKAMFSHVRDAILITYGTHVKAPWGEGGLLRGQVQGVRLNVVGR